jgi:hypothetical protein
MKFISRTTIAITPTKSRAVPRKIEVMTLVRSGQNQIRGISPSAMPHAKGTAIPAADTVIAALPTRFTNLRSVSIPVRKHENAELRHRIDHALLFGILWEDCVLQVWPNRTQHGGPSTMPAMSWPMTAGWLNRCMASPSSRPTIKRSPICPKKIASEGPDGAPSAEKAGDVASTARTAPTIPAWGRRAARLKALNPAPIRLRK